MQVTAVVCHATPHTDSICSHNTLGFTTAATADTYNVAAALPTHQGQQVRRTQLQRMSGGCSGATASRKATWSARRETMSSMNPSAAGVAMTCPNTTPPGDICLNSLATAARVLFESQLHIHAGAETHRHSLCVHVQAGCHQPSAAQHVCRLHWKRPD